jgi:CPA2 family monovalent cation:H+ antiporter-2
LTVAVAAAALASVLAVRLKLHPILGYLAAGILIGPFTPGYVARGETLSTLATLGLIFLLFSLGLGFSFAEVRRLGVVPLAGNAVATTIAAAAAGLGAHLLGLPHPITIGLTMAVSSTAVGAALLERWQAGRTLLARFTIAQLVVQDLVSVALLVLVTAPASSLSVSGVVVPVLKAIGFVAVALVAGATLLQRLVRRIIARASSEGLFIAFAALALVSAWIGYLAGLSFEFGAFVAGAVISEAAGSMIVASVVEPFRALFVALFFVSIGMVLDPRSMAGGWVAIFAFGLALVVVRLAAWSALARIAGMLAGSAFLAGIAMTAFGEFNVVLVDGALAAKRLTPPEGQLLLGITFLSIVVAIVLGPLSPRVAPLRREVRFEPEGQVAAEQEPLVAIVGFGRVGRTVGAVLRRAEIPFVALEQDRRIVEEARSAGFPVVHGNATDPFALDRVLVPSVDVVLIALPEASTSVTLTERIAHRGARVVARASRGGDVQTLRERGAELALVPEAEGALAFARVVLRALEVSDERAERQLDAERDASPALLDRMPP